MFERLQERLEHEERETGIDHFLLFLEISWQMREASTEANDHALLTNFGQFSDKIWTDFGLSTNKGTLADSSANNNQALFAH
jgi:hypothetical protein